MKIDANTPIKVYNHNVSGIGMQGQLRDYYLSGSRGIPTVLTMPFSEVEYINSRTPAFRSGAVRFDPEVQDDVYKALYLDNWQDTVLFDEEIERIIRENDMDAAAKFVNVTDFATIQRIRGHLVGLENDENIDVSKRMINLINTRYDEINRGIRHSKINIEKTKDRVKKDEDPRISMLQEQLATLQEQLAAMNGGAEKKKPAQKQAPRKTTARATAKDTENKE